MSHDVGTRDEHMAWCKQRALEYVDRGQLHDAFASMVSDLKKHSQTADHLAIELGMGLIMLGDLQTPQSMRKFIEGFA